MSLGFPTRGNTNLAVHPETEEISDIESGGTVLCIYIAKTKAQISCAVTAQMICTFMFSHM